MLLFTEVLQKQIKRCMHLKAMHKKMHIKIYIYKHDAWYTNAIYDGQDVGTAATKHLITKYNDMHSFVLWSSFISFVFIFLVIQTEICQRIALMDCMSNTSWFKSMRLKTWPWSVLNHVWKSEFIRETPLCQQANFEAKFLKKPQLFYK